MDDIPLPDDIPFPGEPAPPFPGEPAPSFPGEPAPPYSGEPAPPFPEEPAPPFPGEPAPQFPEEPAPQFPGEPAPPVPDIPAEEVCNIKLPDDVNNATTEENYYEILPPIPSEDFTNDDDNCIFSERHEMMTSRADVPVPGESEHEFYTSLEDPEQYVPNGPANLDSSEATNSEIPMPSSETFTSQPAESEPKVDQNSLSENAAAMASTQAAYTAANYMPYASHMTDPSMMTHHNYPYSYSHDYVSMYHNHRMAARPSYHPNAYSYQGYNYPYAVPPMQQMYDGRSMNPYAAHGNYSQQMLPPTPPLPQAHPSMNSYNPPLPSDYSASLYSSNETLSVVKDSEKQQELPIESNKTNDDILPENNLPPLPNEGMPEEQYLSDEIKNVENPEEFDPASAEPELIKDESTTELVEDAANINENLVHSEDTNRYSPSLPMEEDDANHPSENAEQNFENRPQPKMSSVLGKAQAKKRLMAFQISKQAAAAQIAAKKQAQASTASFSGSNVANNLSSKNRKENDEFGFSKIGSYENGSSTTFEYFESSSASFDDKHSKKKSGKKANKVEKARETIEQIEEIKRNEMLIRDNSILYRQALINDSVGYDPSSENASDKRDTDDKKKGSRKRSRSRSKRHSRSRSRDRKYRRNDKKYRRRSRSRTRSRSKSHSRSSSRHRDKKAKASEVKCWGDFKEAGYQLDRYRRIKFKENKNFLESEIEKRKKEESKHGTRRHRSRSRERRSISIEKEVVEGGRKKKVNMLEAPMEIKQPVVFTRDKNALDDIIEYPSHIVQYTNTRPIIKYCENLKHARLHFISRAELLDSVPDDIAQLAKRFWSGIRTKRFKNMIGESRSANTNELLQKFIETGENKPSNPNDDDDDDDDQRVEETKFINWWSKSPLQEGVENQEDTYVIDEEDENMESASFLPTGEGEKSASAEKTTTKTSTGIRKSRFEDAAEEKTDVSIVVRSRWDSDYEDSPKNTSAVSEKSAERKPTEEKNRRRKSSPVKNNNESFERVRGDEFSTAANKEDKDADDAVAANKNSDRKRYSVERHANKNKDRLRYCDNEGNVVNKNEDTSNNKLNFASPEEWREESDYESRTTAAYRNSDNLNSEKNAVSSRFDKASEANKCVSGGGGGGGGGDCKLDSEYEEFLKMVSFEQPEEAARMPMYEGPKPPPRLNEIPDNVAVAYEPSSNFERKPDAAATAAFDEYSDEDKTNKLDVNDEEEFDIDKFFLKEKEKKLKKMNMLNAAATPDDENELPSSSSSLKRKNDQNDSSVADEKEGYDTETKRKKRDKKNKKRKLSSKVKKQDTKNKNKKKAGKKKKYDESSSDSVGVNKTTDDSVTSDNSSSSDSSTSSSSSDDGGGGSSSEDSSAGGSLSRKKRKKAKKYGGGKTKRKERKLTDKGKKKKRRKLRESDSDDGKKSKRAKKSRSEDGKKKKSKKLASDNYLELLEKSLVAASLKKTESDGSPVSKKPPKEKRSKKRKKKADKEKKEKQKELLSLLSPESAKRLQTSFLEEGEVSEDNKSSPDKSSGEVKKRRKKSKKKKSDANSLNEVAPKWKKKKIDPKEIEENIAKIQLGNPFFEGNLDDWDKCATDAPAVDDSMRDDTKNVVVVEKVAKKKKTKKKKEGKAKDKSSRKKKKRSAAKKRKKQKTKSGGGDGDDVDVKTNVAEKTKSDTKPCKDVPAAADEAERNFAMFSTNVIRNEGVENDAVTVAGERDDDLPTRKDTYADFKFDFLKGDLKKSPSMTSSFGNEYGHRTRLAEDSLDSNKLNAHSNSDRLTGTDPDRYTPTECDAEEEEEEEEETTVSNSRKYFETSIASETGGGNSSQFIASSVFPCFSSSQNLQNATTYSPTLPTPVPAPEPVPPPSLSATTKNRFSAAVGETAVELDSILPDRAPPTPPPPPSDVLKNFGKCVVEPADDSPAANLSIGKLEIRTKAARKFVHSNIFDSFDVVEEDANLEAPCKAAAAAVTEIVVAARVADPKPMSRFDGNAVEKDDCHSRLCIELPDMLREQRKFEASSTDERENVRENSAMNGLEPNAENVAATTKRERNDDKSTATEVAAAGRESEPSIDRRRSRSRDRREKYNRRDNWDDSYDDHRNRRSRSRSRGRHKKRDYRDRRGRRKSRERKSRSRSRRSREREPNDRHARRRYESPSNEKRSSRSGSAERVVRRGGGRASPKSNRDSGAFKNTLANIKTEKEDRRNANERQHSKRNALHTANDDADYAPNLADNNVFESSRYESDPETAAAGGGSLHSSADKRPIEPKPQDMNVLQENLCQLKETLKNLNEQGVQLDDLHNVLSALESTQVVVGPTSKDRNKDSPLSQTNSEQAALQRVSSPTTADAAEGKPSSNSSNVDLKKIISLCQAIQSSLPGRTSQQGGSVATADEKSREKSPTNATLPLKTKKSVADSTNTGFTNANSVTTFKERSREISPKPLSLDERLELELGVKRTATPSSVPNQTTSRNTPANPYYSVPIFEGVLPDFSTPPPPVPNYCQIINQSPEMGYYTPNVRQSLDWNSPEAFIGQNMTNLPQHMIVPHQLLPQQRVLQKHAASEPIVQKPYRFTDTSENKVHSIQVGNVLQIVPSELPMTPTKLHVSSQTKISPQKPAILPNVAVSSSSQIMNTSVRNSVQSSTGFSSILSGHLPVSFAAAPAVSGSRSSAFAKEQKQSANETRSKTKDFSAISPSVISPPSSFSGSKILNLPLPPGTPEAEVQKLMRLAKESRKLKVKGIHESPATPNSDDSNLLEDIWDGNDEPLASITIKPSPEQGILVSPGFKEKSTPVTALGRSIIGSTRKMVSFVDGVRPGSASVVEMSNSRTRKPSPPPDVNKKKHKVRVKIIRPDDSDDDDLPPPPPPGPPPPELYPTTLGPMSVLPPGYIRPKI